MITKLNVGYAFEQKTTVSSFSLYPFIKKNPKPQWQLRKTKRKIELGKQIYLRLEEIKKF